MFLAERSLQPTEKTTRVFSITVIAAIVVAEVEEANDSSADKTQKQASKKPIDNSNSQSAFASGTIGRSWPATVPDTHLRSHSQSAIYLVWF